MRTLTLSIALLALALPSARAQTSAPAATRVPGEEGSLDNDAFLPTSAAAAARLWAGDETYGKLAARNFPSDAGSERAWTQVFESWRQALVETACGDCVAPRPIGATSDARSPWPDPDGTAANGAGERRVDGVEDAVLRRIIALSPAQRAAWTARFESLAAQALTAAGQEPRALADVERMHPATGAAARAALALAEIAFEEGRAGDARGWLGRARSHVELASLAGTPLEQSLRRREQAVAPSAAAVGEAAPEAWEHATDLRPIGQVAIQDLRRRSISNELAPGVGVQPGLCFLENGVAVVQSAERVFVLDPKSGARQGDFEPAKLLEPANVEPEVAYATPEAPGWPLVPASDGRNVVLVHGRSRGARVNAVVCVSLASALGSSESRPLLPELRWAVAGDRRLRGDGKVELERALTLEELEFQPGPLILGDLVLVQARELSRGASSDDQGNGGLPLFTSAGEIRSWLFAFDLASGALRWKRFLGKGVDLARSVGRFVQRNEGRSASQPLASLGGRVLASTHVGVAALVDALDGRVAWSLKNRRRSADRRAWSGASAPLASTAGFLWAPADGDFLYALRGEPDLDGRGLFLRAPHAIDAAEALAGGSPDEALVLARAGRDRVVASWNLSSGGQCLAPLLAPGEGFSGEALVGPARALVATERRLVLLDRTRELYLLDEAPLEKLDTEPAGGSVHARGDRVYVVGPRVVWMFEAR